MKRYDFVFLVLLIGALLFSTATSPYIPYYGGKIWFENISTKNVFCEMYYLAEDGTESQEKICVETAERLYFLHTSDYQAKGNPNNFFTRILLFDIDAGELLATINVDLDTFIHESGNLKDGKAIFRLLINEN